MKNNKWIRNYGYFERADLAIWQYCGFLLYGCKKTIKVNACEFLVAIFDLLSSWANFCWKTLVFIATLILLCLFPIILPIISFIDRSAIRRELTKD